MHDLPLGCLPQLWRPGEFLAFILLFNRGTCQGLFSPVLALLIFLLDIYSILLVLRSCPMPSFGIACKSHDFGLPKSKKLTEIN